MSKNLDEPIKASITSANEECRIYIIYHSGDLKIIEPNGTIIFIQHEDLEEINEAIRK